MESSPNEFKEPNTASSRISGLSESRSSSSQPDDSPFATCRRHTKMRRMTFPIWKGMEDTEAVLRPIDPALSRANVKVESRGGYPDASRPTLLAEAEAAAAVEESVWKR